MVRVEPFAAIRPLPERAAEVSSVPYDVVNTDEARALAAGNPHSFLHVIRSEIDLPPGTDPYDAAVYAQAREALQRLLAEGVLVRECEPKMYLYRLVMNDRSQTGLVGCCHVDDYTDNLIRKHETTRRDKEDDRTRHMLTVGAHPGPVLLTYRNQPQVEALVRRDTDADPLFHFTAADTGGPQVKHTLWAVKNPDSYREIFAGTDAVYVADGHHRCASAARAAAERRAANTKHTGQEQYNWFPVVLFPANELTILPYHRVVTDLGGQSAERVLQRLGSLGELARTDLPQPQRAGVLGIYLDGHWHRLEFDPHSIDHADPVNSLDVAVLQQRVLEPVLGISNPRGDPRIDFVGGARGTTELQRRVDRGDAAVAFALYPTSIEQLLTVADAGLMMPPKATWFEPKLRSGLFVHALDA